MKSFKYILYALVSAICLQASAAHTAPVTAGIWPNFSWHPWVSTGVKSSYDYLLASSPILARFEQRVGAPVFSAALALLTVVPAGVLMGYYLWGGRYSSKVSEGVGAIAEPPGQTSSAVVNEPNQTEIANWLKATVASGVDNFAEVYPKLENAQALFSGISWNDPIATNLPEQAFGGRLIPGKSLQGLIVDSLVAKQLEKSARALILNCAFSCIVDDAVAREVVENKVSIGFKNYLMGLDEDYFRGRSMQASYVLYPWYRTMPGAPNNRIISRIYTPFQPSKDDQANLTREYPTSGETQYYLRRDLVTINPCQVSYRFDEHNNNTIVPLISPLPVPAVHQDQ
jgi:hypothetical protein